MPLLGVGRDPTRPPETPENKRKVPLTDYVGSFIALWNENAPFPMSKQNPHSSRLIDTIELNSIGLIDISVLPPVDSEDDVLPNKPDLRISDLSPYSKLQRPEQEDESPGGKV